jgi:mannose-6-phosphate isomerase-like protein (cupin superfamily)
MRRFGIVAFATMAFLGANLSAQAVESTAAKDKATYFPNSDFQAIWKDLEAKQGLNKRVLEGGAYSVNVRIVKPSDPPLLHAASLDIWVVMSGSATAVTGGQLADMKKRPNSDDAAGTAIMGGVEQPLKAGDVLYVPPGVPHGFKDINGFRAFLIRMDTK